MQDQTRDGGLLSGSFDRQHQGSAQAFSLSGWFHRNLADFPDASLLTGLPDEKSRNHPLTLKGNEMQILTLLDEIFLRIGQPKRLAEDTITKVHPL